MTDNPRKILLHTCCAPCTAYPLSVLRKERFEVFAFFFNPNIHPFQEYRQRRDAFTEYARMMDIRVILRDEYNLVRFLRNVVYREDERCTTCYFARLEAAARTAKKGNFDCFSTTLLYSKLQKHDVIRELGQSLAKRHGVPFFYSDFREGWKEGIRAYGQTGLYKQQYCGCIYSEGERYLGRKRLLSGRPGDARSLLQSNDEYFNESRDSETT